MANEVPILTAFKSGEETVDRTVKSTVITRSSILQVLPFKPVNSGFTLKELEEVEGASGSVAFRALNEDYTDSYADVRERQWGLKQIGGSVKVDKIIEQQYPGTYKQQVQMRLKALGSFVDYAFINGDSSASTKEFDGLKKILGNSGSGTVGSGSDITIDTDATSFKSFLKRFDDALPAVKGKANAAFMNHTVYNAIQGGARHIGANYLGTAADFLGQQIVSYQGVPFYRLGNNNSGSPILPMTETNSTSSIYICNLDELDGTAGLSSNGIQLLVDPQALFYRTVINFMMGLRVVTNSAVRLMRVKAA